MNTLQLALLLVVCADKYPYIELNPSQRSAAVRSEPSTYSSAGPDGRRVFRVLVRSNDDHQDDKKKDIPESTQALDALLRSLSTPQLCTRADALKFVEFLRASDAILAFDHGKIAVPALREVLRGQERIRLLNALSVLSLIGPEATSALPVLVELLDRRDPELRGGAAEVLGDIGPGARRAVPVIRKLLSDKDTAVRARAARALVKIDKRETVRAAEVFLTVLNQGRKDETREITDARLMAIRGLGETGLREKDVLDKLGQLLKSDEKDVQIEAALAIARIDQTNRDAIKLLKSLVDEPDLSRRDALRAIVVLARSRDESGSMLRIMAKLMDEEDRTVSMVKTLSELPVDAKLKVKMLGAALSDRKAYVRQSAALVLGKMGPQAKQGLNMLRPLLADEDRFVRWQVRGAIEQIERKTKNRTP